MGHKKNHAPNDNTPVKTGVLWGCIWNGVACFLRAGGVPLRDHQQQVADVVWIAPAADDGQ